MNPDRRYFSYSTVWLAAAVILLDILMGSLANLQPLYLGLVIVAVGGCLSNGCGFCSNLMQNFER